MQKSTEMYSHTAWLHPYGEHTDKIYRVVGADWVGDSVPRRSRDGGCEVFETYLLEGRTCVQQTVARSTGESGRCAICNGETRGPRAKSSFEEMGFLLTSEVGTDGRVARGITARSGSGRVRHLVRGFLCAWTKEKVQEKLIRLAMIGTATDRADFQTKGFEPAGPSASAAVLCERRSKTIECYTSSVSSFVAVLFLRPSCGEAQFKVGADDADLGNLGAPEINWPRRPACGEA